VKVGVGDKNYPSRSGVNLDLTSSGTFSEVSVATLRGEEPGKLKSNQDNFHVKLGDGAEQSVLSVYDGHGHQGEKISGHCATSLVRRVLGRTTGAGFKRAFKETEDEVLTMTEAKQAGSTATVVSCKDGTARFAWIGDSRAVVAQKGEPSAPWAVGYVTKDHKPDDPSEHARIAGEGGLVKYSDGGYRVHQPKKTGRPSGLALNMSRSFGDNYVKAYGVSPEPEVYEYKLTKRDKFIFLCSDGVWEFIGSYEAILLVSPMLETGDTRAAAKALLAEAQQRWKENAAPARRDDITIIIAKLDASKISKRPLSDGEASSKRRKSV
jgi:serine/threonine protein phosphatase PrpC